MSGADHRKKAKKNRNGRNHYEKGRTHYGSFPHKKLVKGSRGSTTHAPAIPSATLADVWPD